LLAHEGADLSLLGDSPAPMPLAILQPAGEGEGALGAPGPEPDAQALTRWLAFASRVAALTCTRAL
jgi:hypothetical protein